MSKFELKKSGVGLAKTGLSLGTGGLASKSKKAHPFDKINYTGNDELDAKAELNEVQKGFIERNKAEAERFRLATDTEYWCALVFQTRDQKDAFLNAMKWMIHGDKYIDGVKVARSMGVELPPAKVPYNISEGKSVTQNLKDLT